MHLFCFSSSPSFSSLLRLSPSSCFYIYSSVRIDLRFSVNLIFLYFSSNLTASFDFLLSFFRSRSCSFFALIISAGSPGRSSRRSISLIALCVVYFRGFFYIRLYLWNSPNANLFLPDLSCLIPSLNLPPRSNSSSESTEMLLSDFSTTSSSSLSTRSF